SVPSRVLRPVAYRSGCRRAPRPSSPPARSRDARAAARRARACRRRNGLDRFVGKLRPCMAEPETHSPPEARERRRTRLWASVGAFVLVVAAAGVGVVALSDGGGGAARPTGST